jgi:hypothetical protein
LQIEREPRGQKQNDEERARLYGERGYLGDVRLARRRDRGIGIGLAKNCAGGDSAAYGQIPYAADREFLAAQQGIV